MPTNPPQPLQPGIVYRPRVIGGNTARRPKDQLWWIETDPKTGKPFINAHPHAGQAAVLAAKERFILMLAGSQSGKTSSGPFWLEREIRLKGPGDYLIVSSNYPLMKRKVLPEFLKLFDRALHLGRWHAADRTYVFHDGETRVMFASATNSEALESATAKAAWLDEAGQMQFRLESWEAIQRRLTLYQGRVLITTTPYGLGWLKTEMFDRALAGDPDYRVVQFASTANPAFPKEEMERVERTMPDWKVRMFYKGLFDQPPGLIYGDYKDSYREQGGHLVKPFPIPQHWPRYLGVDFGGVNTAKLFLAYDPLSDCLYAYDEALSGGKTAAQHVEDAATRLAGGMLAGAWGGAPSEDSWRLEWAAGGIPVQEPPIKDVEVGIDRVTAWFKARKLLLFDTLRGLRDELGTYSRPMDEEGNVLAGIVDKHRFHRCLAAGTLVETDRGPVPIERVRPGDRVRTRDGERRVLDAELTQRAAPVLRLRLSNGHELVGTPDHLVWRDDVGWVRLDALRYGNVLQCSPTAAGRPSARTATPPIERARPAAAIVWAVEPAGRADVYNLTVEGAHEYFANSVLTHNCDALRYVCLGVGGSAAFALPVLALGSARGGWSGRR